jgi:hypothetical protein
MLGGFNRLTGAAAGMLSTFCGSGRLVLTGNKNSPLGCRFDKTLPVHVPFVFHGRCSSPIFV